MNSNQTNEISKRYIQRSLWLVIALALCSIGCLSYVSVKTDRPMMTSELVITVVYSIVAIYAYGLSWRAVAKTSLSNLTKFYMAGSALRMLTAAMVVIVYGLIVRVFVDIRNFVIMFMVFYLATLIFDVVFFARVEKNNKIEN
jgi:hypothetical protein